jgi:methionyl aminopeptidase
LTVRRQSAEQKSNDNSERLQSMDNQFQFVLRSRREIKKMRVAGLIVWQAHQAGAKLIRPGVTTAEIDVAYVETFRNYDAKPLFLNYGGTGSRPPFPAVTCISTNEEVVHGIPGSRKLVDGDIVSVDTGCKISGWCGDAAVTHPVGNISDENKRLLKNTHETLDLAIRLMGECSKWSEVAKEMQDHVENAGFSVVREMVGHGIGQELHEPPQVPNYFSESNADGDFELKPGVVLAVEPMVNAGTRHLEEGDDGWTITTSDRKPSAHFEHTIAITADGPVRLTGPPTDEELELVPEEFRDSNQWVNW